jgi:6-phosphogluconolactonase/glucosamine-6-phosphate isomerase/deaminase
MLALAGGATPEKMYRVLAQSARRRLVDWRHTYLFFGDERLVRPDDPSRNFALVQRTLLAPVAVPAGQAFPVPTHLGAAAAATEYAATLSWSPASTRPRRCMTCWRASPTARSAWRGGVCPADGTLTWFVDEAAASRLTRSG